MNSLCFSVPLFNRWLFLLIAGLKLKNSLRKWQSPPQNSSDKSFFLGKLTGFVPQFWIFDHTLSCVICSSLHLCLSSSVAQFQSSTSTSLEFLHPLSLSTCFVQDTTPAGVLSSCGCHEKSDQSRSSQGYMAWCGCHDILIQRGITVLFLANVSLYIRPNYDSGGWASRIIHFSLLVFSTEFTTLIWQETISLAIRNYSFRPQMEGRLTCRDISPVVIPTKRMHLLHRSCKNSTHYWDGKRSLFRKDRRSIFLLTADTEGMIRWLWQVSISFS